MIKQPQFKRSIQGFPSGYSLPFVAFKTKVPPQYDLLIIKAMLKLKSTKGSAQPNGRGVKDHF